VGHFKWTKKREKAACDLADGRTQHEVAQSAGTSRSTIQRWLDDPEFAEEVDRLTLMTGIAVKAERLRIAKRMVRGVKWTKRDILDWLKYAQGETDGLRLDLAELLAAIDADDP
jgi:ParB-like chromosome segregation protein Spo0J